MRRVKAAVIGVALIAGSVLTAAPAEAGVPYSWWCYWGNNAKHTSSSQMVGYYVANYGARCYGGFYSWT